MGATTATDLTDMGITERGLLMPSLLLRLLPTLRLRLIPGMDTTATATGHTDMATTLQALWLCLLGLSATLIFPCRLCCETPVFAKQFSFCTEKQFCFVRKVIHNFMVEQMNSENLEWYLKNIFLLH